VGASLDALGVMLVLIGLLVTWETLVHRLREKTPTSLLPVIESILGEIGGLGFIGLLLEVWRPDNHELLEKFEFFHSVFFQVAVACFVFSGLLISFVVFQLEQLRTLSIFPNPTNTTDDSSSTPSSSSLYGTMTSLANSEEDTNTSSDTNIYWRELTLTTQQRVENFSLKRQYLLKRYGLDAEFRFDMEPVFAAYLQKMVHLNPIQAWVPLIPILAAVHAVDLSHGVINNAASENALRTAGYFATTRVVWIPVVMWQLAVFCVSIFNFVRMAQFKEEHKHLIASGTTTNNNINNINKNINSNNNADMTSSTSASNIVSDDTTKTEHSEAQKVEVTDGDQLLTPIPDWYLSSIKFHAWLTLSGIVFFVTEVLSRDVIQYMIFQRGHQQVLGNLDSIVRLELSVFSIFVLSSLFQLWLTPSVFWNLCLLNFGQDQVSKTIVEEQINNDVACR
jgi:hypothetical protein